MTQIRTLLTGMALNSWKKVSNVNEETTFASGLPDTTANFGDASSGTGTVVPTASRMSFSSAALSELDGYAFLFSGGHSDSKDGSFFGFNLENAAANINTGGSGTTWDLLRPSGKYIDAFTNSEPVWSTQTPVDTPTGTGQYYWVTTNKNGQHMPFVGHCYHYPKFLTGTKTVLLSNKFGFVPSGSSPDSSIGAPWCYDCTNDILTAISPSFVRTGDGFTIANGYNYYGGVAPSPDGSLVLCGISFTFGWGIGGWTNPTNATTATFDWVPSRANLIDDQANDVFPLVDGVTIPDPSGNGDIVYFQHGVSTGSVYSDSHFMVATGAKGIGTQAIDHQTYLSGTITTNGKLFLHYAYDTIRSIIWMTDGDHLFQITPSSSLTSWTISQVTGSTGDPPPSPAGDTAKLPSLIHVPSQDCLVHCFQGAIRVYKPAGWNPPADVVPAQPYQPWYQLGPFLAQ